jgi:predicted RND superfamily exporter protein
MGVAITGAIVIGIAVDDTIHFLVKYFNAKKDGSPVSKALDEVLLFAGKPILFTTIVLSLSFSVLIFSDFEPNQKFGIVTSLALIIALLADLILLPALLARLDKK